MMVATLTLPQRASVTRWHARIAQADRCLIRFAMQVDVQE